MMKIHISGQMPPEWEEALHQLTSELGMVVDPNGIPITCLKGEETSVRSDGTFGNTNVMEEIATSSTIDW